MNIKESKIKILWMMDETIAQARPEDWERVAELEKVLVETIGNPNFDHEIIHPLFCLSVVVEQLKSERFSCIFDLTGWLTPALKEIFPNTPIESNFSLSRVRVVSSPRLETSGYSISMSPEEIEEHKRELDLSKPLIVDDVSFSGWTARKTMELWGMNPEKTTHAFLIANTGSLDSDQQGAVKMLRQLESRVFFGRELKTPEEDGWHLKDLHQNPQLEESFTLALLFQEIVSKNGLESLLAQEFLGQETVRKTLFPEHLTSHQIKELIRGGKFIPLNETLLKEGIVHAKNPFLWASPYFQQHVDLTNIIINKDGIIEILKELRFLTSDPEAKQEAAQELKREVQRILSFGPEGQLRREERLI